MRGNWDGEVYYTYTEGPRAGKKNVEMWKDGEIVKNEKYYGKGEEVLVKDWEDLQKLETLTKP